MSWWHTAASITTPRLRLRAVGPDDAVDLADALATNRAHLAPWIAVPDPGVPATWMRDRAAALADAFARGQRMLYTIRDRDERLHGCCGLKPRGDATIALSYWLCASSVGRGFAREAAEALCHVALEQAGAARVLVEVHPDNHRSARVARSLGFVATERQPELHVFTLTARSHARKDSATWMTTTSSATS